MANPTQQPPPAPPASAAPADPTLQNTEQQVAERRLRDLQDQASKAAAETNAAKSELAGVKGDLDRANVALAGLRDENERLKQQLAKQAVQAAKGGDLPTLPVELPKNAKQLVESVTISAITDNGSVRATPKRGDVVIVGKPEDAEELQGEIGQLVRVYAVDKQTAQELLALKHLA